MVDRPGETRRHLGMDPARMSRTDIYKIMAGAIVPRPIAWVSTRSLEGIVNLAPFSAFTMISQDPPLLLFQRIPCYARRTRSPTSARPGISSSIP